MGMMSQWPVVLMAVGWASLYFYVLHHGQTVPESAHLRESWLFPGQHMGEPTDRRFLPDWNVWIDWKANLHAIFGLMGAYVLLAKLFTSPRTDMERLGPRRRQFMWIFGVFFVLAMHGLAGASVVGVIAFANYMLARALSRWMSRLQSSGRRPLVGQAMLIVWAFNVPIMFLIFRFMAEDEASGSLKILLYLPERFRQMQPMIGFQGLGPWHSYRYTCLRFVSFAADAILAHADAFKAGAPKASSGDAVTDHVVRVTETPHDAERYFGASGPFYFIAYVCYPPLYFAGPILSYNGFVAQVDKPSHIQSPRDLAKYAAVIVMFCCILDASLHILYYPGWLGSDIPVEVLLHLSLVEIVVVVHWLLNFEFMSLLVVWRFQRLVAALDGIDVFENMTRNINLMCSFEEMWRIWHVSLNKFAIRYIYVPLGGKKRPLVGVCVTFIFVAFWHEVNGAGTAAHWYVWGLLNFIFVTLEKIALPRKPAATAPLAIAVRGAVTYLFLQSVNVHALTAWNVSYLLSVRLLFAWTLLAPPILYGLQAIAADRVSRAEIGRAHV